MSIIIVTNSFVDARTQTEVEYTVTNCFVDARTQIEFEYIVTNFC